MTQAQQPSTRKAAESRAAETAETLPRKLGVTKPLLKTQAAAERLKADAERYERRDGTVPGLALVVWPSGKKSWVLRYRPSGSKKVVKHTLGKFPEPLNLKEARRKAGVILADVGEGQNPHKAKMLAKRDGPDRDLFEKVFERFLTAPTKKGQDRRERTISEWRRMIGKDVLPEWSDKRVQDITADDCDKVLERIVERGGRITANRVHTALKAAFNFAVSKRYIASSPMAGVAKPTSEQSRARVLTDDEIKTLWTGLAKLDSEWRERRSEKTKAGQPTRKRFSPAAPFVRFLLLTGCRRDEAANIVWDEVQDHAWHLPTDRNKSRVERITPLSDEAMAALESVPKIDGDKGYVFTADGQRGMTCMNSLKRNVDKATGLTDWTLHDLRRTCSTTLHRLGFPPHVCEAVLGHRFAVGVAATYNRWQYYPEKKMALDVWATFCTSGFEAAKARKFELEQEARQAEHVGNVAVLRKSV